MNDHYFVTLRDGGHFWQVVTADDPNPVYPIDDQLFDTWEEAQAFADLQNEGLNSLRGLFNHLVENMSEGSGDE